MTKTEMLAMMRLLSALESWSMAKGDRMPFYMHEQLVAMVDILEREILDKKEMKK
jgi:hypothetical protein